MEAREQDSGRIERVIALRAFPGFNGLPPDHLALLADFAYDRYFRRGDAVTLPGGPVSSIFFIRRGKVNVIHDGVVVRTFTSGAVVGGLAAMTRDPQGQHLVAAADTDTFEVHVDDMEDFFEDSFPTMLVVLRGLALGVLETRLQFSDDAGYERVDDGNLVRPIGELGLVQRILFARRLMAYGRGRIEALAELARDMEVLRFSKGDVLYRQGDPATHAVLVCSGGVQCESDLGQRFVIGPESTIGSIDSMAGVPRWYTATALTDIVALRSDVTNLIDVIEDHSEMGMGMIRVLAKMLRSLQERLYTAIASSV